MRVRSAVAVDIAAMFMLWNGCILELLLLLVVLLEEEV